MVLGPMFKLIGPCINEVRSSVLFLTLRQKCWCWTPPRLFSVSDPVSDFQHALEMFAAEWLG